MEPKYKKEDLEKLILIENKSYEEIGRLYGVTGAYIKKKAKSFGILLPIRAVFPKNFRPHNKIDDNTIIPIKDNYNETQKKYQNRKKKNCIECGKITINKFCSHICQQEKNRKIRNKKIESGDLTLGVRNYKKYLIEKYGEKCMECGWCEINKTSNKVPIELEHIDGNSENNELTNLKLLCPNCHSLTPTYKALNTGNGRHNRKERYRNGKSF